MLLPFRQKVVKRCAEGHVMDLAWRSCPRCTGQSDAGVAREMTERTVVMDLGRSAPPDAKPAAPVRSGPPILARLHVEEGPLEGRDFDLAAGRFKLGKAPREEPGASLLPLDDPYMSRDHCAVTAGVAAVILNDLMSTNGTFVNGERVQRRVLESGDRVRLGRTTLIVTLAPRG